PLIDPLAFLDRCPVQLRLPALSQLGDDCLPAFERPESLAEKAHPCFRVYESGELVQRVTKLVRVKAARDRLQPRVSGMLRHLSSVTSRGKVRAGKTSVRLLGVERRRDFRRDERALKRLNTTRRPAGMPFRRARTRTTSLRRAP